MRVLVADDQAAVRSALRWFLNEEPGVSVVGEAIRVEDLLAQAGGIQPDLVLLDWELPGLFAASFPNSASPSTIGQARCRLLNALHALHSCPKVIALSGRPEVRQEALDAGADGFVSKGDPPERLLTTLRTIDAEVNALDDRGQNPKRVSGGVDDDEEVSEMGRGRGGARGGGAGRGGGRGPGWMGGPKAAGHGGGCVCPSCGHREPHVVGQPCYQKKCPQCGTQMARE